MSLKLAKKVSPKTEVSIEDKVQEYDSLRVQKKIIDDRMKILAAEIKDYAQKNGVKDDKGSFSCENDSFIYGSTAKKSITFIKDKAIDFFKSHGLSKAVVTVETLDEDAIEAYVNDGRISYEELESLTTTKVSYSVSVVEKESMPVVEQTEVKSAASRKPRR